MNENKMARENLREKLLKGMCWCAEHGQLEPMPGIEKLNLGFFGTENPGFFKPGVGDRLIFNLIVDRVIGDMLSEDDGKTNKYVMGTTIMSNYYFPDYSEWDRQQLEEARELNRK